MTSKPPLPMLKKIPLAILTEKLEISSITFIYINSYLVIYETRWFLRRHNLRKVSISPVCVSFSSSVFFVNNTTRSVHTLLSRLLCNCLPPFVESCTNIHTREGWSWFSGTHLDRHVFFFDVVLAYFVHY